jgi:hypothetical protein
MWGQYARSKDENGKWQDGVCIELESDMFMRPDNVFYEHRINYLLFILSMSGNEVWCKDIF